jgi:hypothetical protein
LFEKRVGKVDRLKLFEYRLPDAVFDSINVRPPKPRCQRWFRGLGKAKCCHAMNYDERIFRNELPIHIGLEPASLRACPREEALRPLSTKVPPAGIQPSTRSAGLSPGFCLDELSTE